MSDWTPSDVNDLVKNLFFGIAIICVPLGTLLTSISANKRAKKSLEASLANAASIQAVSTNVDRLEKNTNSISERNEAIAEALGVHKGIKQERESVAAHSVMSAAIKAEIPLPVTDERMAADVTAGLKEVVDAIKDSDDSGAKKK